MVFDIKLAVLLAVTVILVQSNPIIIRSGISKDHGQRKDDNIYDYAQHKGISNYEGAEGFNTDSEKKHVQAADIGKYGEESANQRKHQDENSYAGEKYHQQTGDEVQDIGKKTARKKGHHNSGFHNSYHKDETGSNSSYYDDSDDRGDEYIRNVNQGSYGDLGQERQRGQHYDGSNYAQEQGKRGYYDNSGQYDKGVGNQRDYNQRRYYGDRQNQDRSNAANQYGEQGRYNEEKYIERPYYNRQKPAYYDEQPYYDARYLPRKKTITIYEDPRVYERGSDYERYNEYSPQYDSDYIHLDVRRPQYDVRYQDRWSPSYDYY